MSKGCYAQMADLYLDNVAYEGLADSLAKLTALAVDIPALQEQRAIDANITMIKNFPPKDDLSALAASNIAKLAVDAETAAGVIANGGLTAMCEALSNMLISEETEEALHILQSMEGMLKLVDAVELDDFGTTLLVESVKMREEPVLVAQAMQTIGMFCKFDAAFCSKFVTKNGLNETLRVLEHFATSQPAMSAPAMAIVTSLCGKVPAEANWPRRCLRRVPT